MSLFVPDVSVAEKILRSAVVYVFLLVAFRMAGKRTLSQMTAFDLIVLLVISNVVQNALIGNDNSVGGGLLGATTILILNGAVAWLTFRSKRLERIIENTPTELRTALRREGVLTFGDVRYAILEEDGQVSVIPRRSEAR